MKKMMMAALAASTLLATPAMAADTVSVHAVTGSVTAICSAAAAATLAFGALTDASGTLNATSQTVSDPTAYCNGAGTTVTVAHASLINTNVAPSLVTSPPSGFTGTVTFVPEIVAGATTLTGDKAALTALGAFSGISVTAKTLAASGKPLAGNYAGSITVTLTPGT